MVLSDWKWSYMSDTQSVEFLSYVVPDGFVPNGVVQSGSHTKWSLSACVSDRMVASQVIWSQRDSVCLLNTTILDFFYCMQTSAPGPYARVRVKDDAIGRCQGRTVARARTRYHMFCNTQN
jgi:hypothetical protein